MANVLSTLFGEIANAIREKTGDTGTMKPAQFPEKIGAIEVGGGSSAEVRYVTFMNGDVELYRKPVAVGDDCVNVLTKGWIATPTKESTVSEVFAYSGWALTDGGNADSSALLAVEEDRTVYAAYTASARMYTVNFYDGETLIESKQVAYGSTPDIANPSKDGCSFDGWTPSIVEVTGDADYYAQWAEKLTFAGASWADIVRVANNGEAQKHFALGDQREFVFTTPSGEIRTATLQIIGFNHDDLADGSGKASMSIMTITSELNIPFKNDTSDYTYKGWATCDARTVLNSTLFNSFPEDLRNGIKPVTKKSTVYVDGTTESFCTSDDRIWVPSVAELYRSASQLGHNDGVFYAKSPSIDDITDNVGTIGGGIPRIRFRSGWKDNKFVVSYRFGANFFDAVAPTVGLPFPFGFCI